MSVCKVPSERFKKKQLADLMSPSILFKNQKSLKWAMGQSINYVITPEGGGGCELVMVDDGRGVQYDDVIIFLFFSN